MPSPRLRQVDTPLIILIASIIIIALMDYFIGLRIRATAAHEFRIINNLRSWSTTPATDFFGQELKFHNNQHHFQAYLNLSTITLGLYREFDHWPHLQVSLLFGQFLSYIAICRLYSGCISLSQVDWKYFL